MNPPIRVLVVDDSTTARTLVAESLRSDPALEVVGEACDGAEAVEMTARLHPHVVTMDLLMPRLDGFAATREIMSATPTPIVVITGETFGSEAETAMRAMRAGALTVLKKLPAPSVAEFPKAARELVRTVKAMSQVKVVRQRVAESPSARRAIAPGHARVVAIAASTGGPQALHAVLTRLPATFAAPILVVQHITHGFLRGFVSWLDKECALDVREAVAGEPLTAGTVYVAPDDRHLGAGRGGVVVLSNAAPIGGFRPSATHLFESVSTVYGAHAAAVIMTGMGRDGVSGLRALHRAGGRVIAQDERTSVVFGMPAEAIAAGVTDFVLPLGEITAAVVQLCSPRERPRASGRSS